MHHLRDRHFAETTLRRLSTRARLGDDWQTSFNLGTCFSLTHAHICLFATGATCFWISVHLHKGRRGWRRFEHCPLAMLLLLMFCPLYVCALFNGPLHSNNRLARLPQFCYNRFLLFERTSGSGSREAVFDIKLISKPILSSRIGKIRNRRKSSIISNK